MKTFTDRSLVFELDCWVGNIKESEFIRSKVNEKIAEAPKAQQIGTPAMMQRVIINELNKL